MSSVGGPVLRLTLLALSALQQCLGMTREDHDLESHKPDRLQQAHLSWVRYKTLSDMGTACFRNPTAGGCGHDGMGSISLLSTDFETRCSLKKPAGPSHQPISASSVTTHIHILRNAHQICCSSTPGPGPFLLNTCKVQPLRRTRFEFPFPTLPFVLRSPNLPTHPATLRGLSRTKPVI